MTTARMTTGGINTGAMSTARMNAGKQPDDSIANRCKSFRAAQSEHTACGQLWGKVRGNRRTTVHSRGRTKEQTPRRTRRLTAQQQRAGRYAHPLWTPASTLAWVDGSCPHSPPCLLQLRCLLYPKSKQPTVGDRPATPCTPRRGEHGIIGSSAIHVPSATIHTHHQRMTCSGQEAARREISG